MGVWHDTAIIESCIKRNMISPFCDDHVNQNTYDLAIGARFKREHPYWIRWANSFHESRFARGFQYVSPPDMSIPLWGEELRETERILLMPGELILAHSVEVIDVPANARGILFLKSSLGREGLEHLHAGLFDAGFRGQATFELKNVSSRPIHLDVGRRIMQIEFADLCGVPSKLYKETGHYYDQLGPVESRA